MHGIKILLVRSAAMNLIRRNILPTRASLRKPNGVVQRPEGVNFYKEIFIFQQNDEGV